ncbi:MAG TPA: FAD-binding oxidoreductase [Thermoplasmata archaeon]|nr:FAD-binding oxidoreductase [Thermoplasmata archaeon]
MEETRVDRLILGAGIAGCALAYHLRRRDAGTVLVYDPRTPAAGASGRAAGVITEQLWDRWDVEVTRESHREYAELAKRWEPDAYQQHGFVRWTADARCAEALDAARERFRAWGVQVEEATRSDLEGWFPAGRFDDVQGALFSRHDAGVRPSSITTIYAEGARSAGAVFDFGVPSIGIERNGREWVLATALRTVRSAELIVAAGAWSGAILRGLGHPLPLVPYRTQAAVLRPSKPPAPFPTGHDLDSDVYLRVEDAGRILGGDGTERVAADPERFDPRGDPMFLGHLATALANRFPGWSESEVVSSWAGVCTSTPDRHPIVGRVSGAAGLYAMTGFNGFGVMRAGGVARRLADLIADDTPDDEIRALLGPADARRFDGAGEPFDPKPGFTLEAGDHPRW